MKKNKPFWETDTNPITGFKNVIIQQRTKEQIKASKKNAKKYREAQRKKSE